MKISDYVISVLRTGAAVTAGAIITWAVAHGIHLSSTITQPLTAVLFAAFTAGWYALVRALEHLKPPFGKAAGYLLAVPVRPVYPVKP